MKKTTQPYLNMQRQKTKLLIASIALLLLLLGPASYKLYTQSIINTYAFIENQASLSIVT